MNTLTTIAWLIAGGAGYIAVVIAIVRLFSINPPDHEAPDV